MEIHFQRECVQKPEYLQMCMHRVGEEKQEAYLAKLLVELRVWRVVCHRARAGSHLSCICEKLGYLPWTS